MSCPLLRRARGGALAARCAMFIQERWPQAAVVLTTGRGRLDQHLPVGEATVLGRADVVVQGERAYMVIGQDPEHGDGVGMMSCIDLNARGDITGKPVWVNKSIGRSISRGFHTSCRPSAMSEVAMPLATSPAL